jgi:predicted RND superfamily exporter protein
MERVFRFIAEHAWLVLGVHAAILLGVLFAIVDPAAPGLRLRIETAVEKILPTEGPTRDRYKRFRETFGNDELLVVGVKTDDLFTRPNLERIVTLTERFSKAPGVRQVVSLSTAPDIRSVDGEVQVRNVLDELPETPEQLQALRERVLGNPLLVGSLISPDARIAAFLIYPEEMTEAEFLDRGIDAGIERIAHETAPDAEILIAGAPPLKAETSRILRRDLFRFVPLNYAIMLLVGFIAFRSVRGTVVPLVSVGIAQLWTLAAMVLMDRSLNLITFIVPALVIAVGFAYAVHVVSEHEEVIHHDRRGKDAVVEALCHVAVPVFLAGLTTAAGFVSLCVSRLPAIQEFGIFCVVGTLAAMLIALTLVPAVLAVLSDPVLAEHRSLEGARFDRFITRLAETMVARRRFVLAVAAAVALVAAFGVTRIHVSTSFVTNLAKDHPLRRSIEMFDRELGGSTTLHVVMESETKGAFKDPAALRELRKVQEWLDQQPEVSSTASVADYVMLVNRALHEGDEASRSIPDSKSLLGQILFFFWHERLSSFIDGDLSASDILVRVPAAPSDFTNRLLDRIEARLAKLPAGLQAHVTGDTPVIVRTIDDITLGQALSLATASILIYVILAVYFRSAWVALIAILPNALPVLIYFGVLGLSGVTLNIITSLIACIVLGIAVDDTIHFMVRFREQAAVMKDEKKAAVEALRIVSRPVASTNIALAAGFLALAVSGLRHMVEFAVLASVMLLLGWLIDMTFTPALCVGAGVAKKGGC